MIEALSDLSLGLAWFAPEIPEAARAAAQAAVGTAPAGDAPLTASEQTLSDLVNVGGMIIIALWSLLLLISDAFAGPGMRQYQRRLAMLGAILAFAAVASQYGGAEYDGGVEVFSGFLVVDHFSMLLDMAIIGIAAAVLAFAGDYARTHRFEYGEQESLLFIAAFGMMILAHAANTLALFLGIETMSIAVYVLVGARWNSKQSSEAAFKYFVMGAFSSGVLLMGLALLYGGTGTTDLAMVTERVQNVLNSWRDVQGAVQALGDPDLQGAGREQFAATSAMAMAPAMLVIPGILLTLGALLFKISAVPFHMWTPDAYEGAPSPITGFMAAGVKIAGFAALLKLFVGSLYIKVTVESPYGWTTAVAVIAILTMTIGNFAAVRQNNVKRLLAYSSVAHVGYLLIGVVAAGSFYGSKAGGTFKRVEQEIWALTAGDSAVDGILFYLLAYSVATLGAFACVAWLSSQKKEATAAHEWSGLASRHPGMALGMTICLLSLMGMPPTAGFVGKLMVFKGGLENTNMLLRVAVIIAVLNSVVGAYYYLRLIVNMYFRQPLQRGVEPMNSRGAQAVVAIAAAGSIIMGVAADQVLRRCELAAAGFNQPPDNAKRAEWVDKLRARWEAEDQAAVDAELAEHGAGPGGGDQALQAETPDAEEGEGEPPTPAAGAP